MLHTLDRAEERRASTRLWVASDSMSPSAWRHLNQLMRQYADNENGS